MVTDASQPTPFASLVPISDGYATMPIADAFDWGPAATACGPGQWYMVAFRSVQHPDADQATLLAYDERAHVEAQGSNGFVHYFKGPPNAAGQCLSFCIWDSREEARAASGRPDHAAAAAIAHTMYSTYTLEFLRVTKRVGAKGFEFRPYDVGTPAVATVQPTDLSISFSSAF